MANAVTRITKSELRRRAHHKTERRARVAALYADFLERQHARKQVVLDAADERRKVEYRAQVEREREERTQLILAEMRRPRLPISCAAVGCGTRPVRPG
jgi:hypothetical protein